MSTPSDTAPPGAPPPFGKRWHTREDSGIRLDRALRWWHDDEPIEHPRIVELFNESLVVADDGRFQLRIGADWCFVQVEDAAFEVRTVDVNPDGRVSVRLSDRTAEVLDAAGLEVGDDGVVVARVKGGRARARFSRDAQYQLGELLEPEPGGGVALVAHGRRVPAPGLGPLLGG